MRLNNNIYTDYYLPKRGGTYRLNFINYSVLTLMMIQPFLGGSKFDGVQIFIEITMMLLMMIGLLLVNVKKIDMFIFATLFFFSAISLLLNDFYVFALNFKMFFIAVLVIAYFTRTTFFPRKSILFFLFINVMYAVYVSITSDYILEGLSILKHAGTYVGSRPIGFLGSPHATSTFIAICLLYLYSLGKHRVFQVLLFWVLLVYASWTALVAILMQFIFNIFDKITPIKINEIVFLSVSIFVLLVASDFVLEHIRNIPGSRYYSVEIMLPMFQDIRFYEPLLSLYPQSSMDVIAQQERTFAAAGNEFGIVKIFIEGGFVLALFLMYRIMNCSKYMVMFLLVTTLHYSFFINMPFIMFLIIVFNKDIDHARDIRVRMIPHQNKAVFR